MKKSILALLGLSGIVMLLSAEIWSDNRKAGYTGATCESTCVNCYNGYALNADRGSVIAISKMINWLTNPVKHIILKLL